MESLVFWLCLVSNNRIFQHTTKKRYMKIKVKVKILKIKTYQFNNLDNFFCTYYTKTGCDVVLCFLISLFFQIIYIQCLELLKEQPKLFDIFKKWILIMVESNPFKNHFTCQICAIEYVLQQRIWLYFTNIRDHLKIFLNQDFKIFWPHPPTL